MTQEHPFTSFSFQDKHNMRFHCRLYRHASQWGGPYGDWICDILELVLHHLLDVVNYPNPENCPQRQVSSVGNLCHGAILVFFPFPFAERVELGFSLRGNLLWIQFVPFSLLKCFCFFKVKKKEEKETHRPQLNPRKHSHSKVSQPQHPWQFEPGNSLLWEAVLTSVGCWAAALASVHWIKVAPALV